MNSDLLDAAAQETFVVQFPHPGEEHNPGNARRQSWNAGRHRRKFLKSHGRFVAEDESVGDGDLVFWGEWEAPSYIIKRWEPKDHLPRFLHSPVWERPPAGMMRQNTDPWVFGDSFRYSNCNQLRHKPQRKRTALQELTPGSVVLFGSTIGGEFVIDTVFVVKDSCRFSPSEPPETDEVFRVCTVESLITTGNTSDDPFTLYRGATLEAPVNGMYSFVPCWRANAAMARFQRPAISQSHTYINPSSTQTPRGAKALRSAPEVRGLWESTRGQVLKTGCLLGVWFENPKFDEASQEKEMAFD